MRLDQKELSSSGSSRACERTSYTGGQTAITSLTCSISEVCRTAEEIDYELRRILDARRELVGEHDQLVVAMDTEWPTVMTERGPRHSGQPTALVQLAFRGHISLLQLSAFPNRTLPESLVTFLGEKRIAKTGAGIAGDLTRISREYCVTTSSPRPLEAMAKARGLCDPPSGSTKSLPADLASLSARILRRRVEKKEDVRCSDWAAHPLSHEQVTYAATDAWASLRLHDAMVNMPPFGEQLRPPFVHGTAVTWSVSGSKAALGEVLTSPEDGLHRSSALRGAATYPIKVTSSKVVIRVTEVLRPTALLEFHPPPGLAKRRVALGDLGPTPFDTVVRYKQCQTRRPQEAEPDNQPRASEDRAAIPMEVDNPDENDDGYTDCVTLKAHRPLSEAELATFESGVDISPDAAFVASSQSSAPLTRPARPTRFYCDPFHFLDQLSTAKSHSLSKWWSCRHRDAVFTVVDEDKAKVLPLLAKRGLTWDDALRDPAVCDWLWQHVRRVIEPPEVLYPRLKKLYSEVAGARRPGLYPPPVHHVESVSPQEARLCIRFWQACRRRLGGRICAVDWAGHWQRGGRGRVFLEYSVCTSGSSGSNASPFQRVLGCRPAQYACIHVGFCRCSY